MAVKKESSLIVFVFCRTAVMVKPRGWLVCSYFSPYMNKFRKLGLTDYNGKLDVHSALLNYDLNERPHVVRNEKDGL